MSEITEKSVFEKLLVVLLEIRDSAQAEAERETLRSRQSERHKQ